MGSVKIVVSNIVNTRSGKGVGSGTVRTISTSLLLQLIIHL